MKTKLLPLIVLGFFLINANTELQSQSVFESDMTFQDLDFSSSFSAETIDLSTYEIDIDDYKLDYTVEDAPKSITENDAQEMVLNYVNMIAFGIGFGINSDQTLWCLNAEYFLRLAMLKAAAVYGALGIGYTGSNSDFVSTSILNVSLKLLMFSLLVKQYQQVRFFYGLFGGYGFGKEKIEDGFDYDLTRLTLGIVVGFQIMLAAQWALMIQTNLFNYQEQTRKYEDFEFTDYSRWALINKANIVAFSLVYTFGNSNRKK